MQMFENEITERRFKNYKNRLFYFFFGKMF